MTRAPRPLELLVSIAAPARSTRSSTPMCSMHSFPPSPPWRPMRLSSWRRAASLCAVVTTVATAQGKPPAPHALGSVEATATELLGAVSTARALPGGRVLVNDVIGRRVLLFEKGLGSFTVVADTTPATGNAYAGRFGGLIAYRGDSTLFVDPQSLSMMVIDPSGKIGRVISVPRPNDAQALVAGNGGIPAFDGAGRLVYRAAPNFRFGGAGRPGGGAEGGRVRVEANRATGDRPAMMLPDFPDSSAIVRVELATRKLDTVTFVKVPRMRLTSTTDTSGRTMMTSVINPLPQVDDWAVLSDGSIAVVRGLDYHVDWFTPDGGKSSTAKLPFEWRPLNDSSKAVFLDSTKVAMEKLRAAAAAQMAANPGQPPRMPGGDAGAMPPMIVFRMQGGPPGGGGGGDSPRPRDQASGPSMNFSMPPLTFVEPNELPDYVPPFTTGAARADMDGNLWVRTSIVQNGGPIYDVVDAKGALIDRVALPAGRVIAGFGAGGVVYMGVREEKGVRLEQARRVVSQP